MTETKQVFEAICDSYEIEIRMLDEQISRIYNLHKPYEWGMNPVDGEPFVSCLECHPHACYTRDESAVFPCTTIKVLEGEL